MPSLKQIREILNQAKFNPKEPGPLNIVSHSSGPSYLETRAMEFIMEAQVSKGNLSKYVIGHGFEEGEELYSEDITKYKQKMIRGIQCLTLAIIKVENGEV